MSAAATHGISMIYAIDDDMAKMTRVLLRHTPCRHASAITLFYAVYATLPDEVALEKMLAIFSRCQAAECCRGTRAAMAPIGAGRLADMSALCATEPPPVFHRFHVAIFV